VSVRTSSSQYGFTFRGRVARWRWRGFAEVESLIVV
jgi:hypothetical protein